MQLIYARTPKSKKRKFKSAEEKARFLAAQESEYGIAKKRKNVGSNATTLSTKSYVRSTVFYPSYGDAVGSATKPEAQKYTGTKMIGIGTLHKSNAVPVFSDNDAKDMAAMRR